MFACVRGWDPAAPGLWQSPSPPFTQIPAPVRRLRIGTAPLHVASRRGHAGVVRLLMQAGAESEEEGASGTTPLIAACAAGHEATVRALLECGAGVETRDGQGSTPLLIAAWKGCTGAVEALLAAGASPAARASGGYTPLFVAAQARMSSPLPPPQHAECRLAFLVSWLPSRSCRLPASAGAGASLSNQPHPASAQEGRVEAARLLIANGAPLDSVDDGGATPLIACAQARWRGRPARHNVTWSLTRVRASSPLFPLGSSPFREGTRLCALRWWRLARLSTARSPTVRPIGGTTPSRRIHLCCSFKDSLGRPLIRRTRRRADGQAGGGDQRTQRDTFAPAGFTALHFAVLYGFVSLARVLLQGGASPEIFNHSGDTARSLADRLPKEAPPARAVVCRDVCELLLTTGLAGAGGSTTSMQASHASSSSSQASGGSAASGVQQQGGTIAGTSSAAAAGGGSSGGGPASTGGGGGPIMNGGIRAFFGGGGGSGLLGKSSGGGARRIVTDL